MKSVSALHFEVSLRLDGTPANERHRPRDVALERFCEDVVTALGNADIPVKASRSGVFATLLELLLTAANEQKPSDLFRVLKKAIAGAKLQQRR